MVWWKKPTLESAGSVLYRGRIPPRAENFEYLTELGVELRPGRSAESEHWALDAKHPGWGEARITCLRDAPLPPDVLIDFDPRLLPDERELARRAGSSVSVWMEATRANVLLERKRMLSYLRALMSSDGVVAVDHTAQTFWSRDDLDSELEHDAELDVLSLFTVHSVTGAGERVFWLHTHGLSELGGFDFDIIDPSPDLDGRTWDLIRAFGFAIVEGSVSSGGPPLEIVGGMPPVRFVASADLRAARGADFPEWVSALDESHLGGHAVACDAERNFLGLFRRKPTPSGWLSGPLGDDMPTQFSQSASELMARRATATWGVFQAARADLEALALPALVKLHYADSRGSVEHLWFEVHQTRDDSVDATLINEPFSDVGLRAGERRNHELSRLSDWSIMSPLGQVTPRSLRLLRSLRQNREEVAAALAAYRAEG
ncbi:MAG: DUF4026 domain-containing protein [Polyangiaceae bacterium]|nr:DUF4026 domain-containing protein [Polyangiaceae bacterium]